MHLGIGSVDLVTSYSALESEKFLANPVETYYIELSEDFERYDASTWTIGDYLMIYATSKGIVNTDISIIEIEGYTSLVYKQGLRNFYRIGKEGDPNALFINDLAVSQLGGYDIDKFLKTNLVSFLLSKEYSRKRFWRKCVNRC